MDEETLIQPVDEAETQEMDGPDIPVLHPDFLYESGILSELNRRFIHPLGLHIMIDNGNVRIYDFREQGGVVLPNEIMIEQGQLFIDYLMERGFADMRRRKDEYGFLAQVWRRDDELAEAPAEATEPAEEILTAQELAKDATEGWA